MKNTAVTFSKIDLQVAPYTPYTLMSTKKDGKIILRGLRLFTRL